jgi:hypothetical protein
MDLSNGRFGAGLDLVKDGNEVQKKEESTAEELPQEAASTVAAALVDGFEETPASTAELMARISELVDQLQKPEGFANFGPTSISGAHDEDDEQNAEADSGDAKEDSGSDSGGASSPVPKKKQAPKKDGSGNVHKKQDGATAKKEAVDPNALRAHWDWDRTEAVLKRCLVTNPRGVLPVTEKGKDSAKITDVFDAQMAVQWVRRMESLRGNTEPLPMRGPFSGKLPTYKRLQENPMRLTALPLHCDLRMSPDEKEKMDHRPYRVGNPAPDLQSQDALNVWNSRSIHLKQFEVISLQLERLAAIQTMAVSELAAAMKKKADESSPEVKAAFEEMAPRLHDLRCLNDFMLNRTELFAYATYKASKCIYMEALGIPKAEWAAYVVRKWGAGELFDGKDAQTVKQRQIGMGVSGRDAPVGQATGRRPPLLQAPLVPEVYPENMPVGGGGYNQHMGRGPMPVPYMHPGHHGPMPMHPHPQGPRMGGMPPTQHYNFHQMQPDPRMSWNGNVTGMNSSFFSRPRFQPQQPPQNQYHLLQRPQGGIPGGMRSATNPRLGAGASNVPQKRAQEQKKEQSADELVNQLESILDQLKKKGKVK